MRKNLIALTTLFILTLCTVVELNAQGAPAKNMPDKSAAASPLELARAAVAAQGGEKFRNMKSLVQSGPLDFYPPFSAQPIHGDFSISVASPGQSRIEVNAPPVIAFKQITNGTQSFSSIKLIQFPDPSTYGLRMLARYDQTGYTVTALPDKGKLRAFRVSAGKSVSTDFFVEAATARVQRYVVRVGGNAYDFELKEVKEIDGLLLPVNFRVKMEIPQGTLSLDFKVKETKVDQPLAEDLFNIPK